MLNKQRAADTGRKDGRTKEGKRKGPLILLNPTKGKHRRSLRRGYDFFQIHFESYLQLRRIHPFRKLPPQFSKKEKKKRLAYFFSEKEKGGSFKPWVSSPRACSTIAICWTWMTSPQGISRGAETLCLTQECVPPTCCPVKHSSNPMVTKKQASNSTRE